VRRKIRAVIVDDEGPERERLVAFLNTETDIEVIAALRGNPTAAATLNRLAPDALFLDVQLRDRCGFELLAGLDAGSVPKIVLVTASREHAVRAFEFGATDYLLKPVNPVRLAEALRRLRSALQRELDDTNNVISSIQQLLRGRLVGHPTRYLDRLMVNERGRLYFVKVSDIEWFEAEDNYVRIHTVGASHLIRQTLSRLQEKLDPSRFARIHRSTIVNLDTIREIQLGVGRERIVILHRGVHLRLSERYGRELERRTRGGGALSGHTKEF
jgi:two-component system LytT family response regulator